LGAVRAALLTTLRIGLLASLLIALSTWGLLPALLAALAITRLLTTIALTPGSLLAALLTCAWIVLLVCHFSIPSLKFKA
jgi:hypothetical protein